MSTVTLTDQFNEAYAFEGTLVSEYSTQAPESERPRPRWVEMALYRHVDGGYVVVRTGYSVVFHAHHSPCDRGVMTYRSELPDDAVPCVTCQPRQTEEVVDLEEVRPVIDRCDAFNEGDSSVMKALTLYRPGTRTPYLSQPARRLLELAEENDPDIRRIRRRGAA